MLLVIPPLADFLCVQKKSLQKINYNKAIDTKNYIYLIHILPVDFSDFLLYNIYGTSMHYENVCLLMGALYCVRLAARNISLVRGNCIYMVYSS